MIDVPFCRPLIAGMRGNDVLSHKRAISRAMPKIYEWHPFTPYFGPYFVEAVKEFQRRKGITPSGKIGSATHEALERNHHAGHDDWAFDALAVQLATDFCKEFGKTPEQKVREAIVDAGLYWYAHRERIRYRQYRPMLLGKPPWIPYEWDCSGFYTACRYAGGSVDPNGRGFDHLGYTGTLMSSGTRVATVQELKPGDAVFYGHSYGKPGFNIGDPTHVALYIGVVDGAHSVLSLGSYPMHLYKYNYRQINHLRHYDVLGG